MVDEGLQQTEIIDFIKNRLGTETWITVYEYKEYDSGSIAYWCALIPREKISKVLETYSWDLDVGEGMPGYVEAWPPNEKEDQYYRFGSDREGIEPFVYYYGFGHKENCLEVIEEFRLMFLLYHDKKTNIYYYIDECADDDPVIKVTDSKIEIRLRYLKQFLGIKKMYLALYFSSDYYSKEYTAAKEIDYCEDNIRYNLCIHNLHFECRDKKSMSQLIGKKIINGYKKEDWNIGQFKKNSLYEDFIIGIDDNGKEVTFTCNPDKLANNFGKNPQAPHYFTQVFFRREVLQKYYNRPETYKVADGFIICVDRWMLRMDNHNLDNINVYLGDLGRDIPYKEQQYFKSFNIIPDGKLSNVKEKRDFLGEFADPEIPDLKFKSLYSDINRGWQEKCGWVLFLELSEKDLHNFFSIRIPLTNEQAEFDSLVLSLVKIIIDSLNEKELEKRIPVMDDGSKGIAKLEKFLGYNGFTEYEVHIGFLKDLQKLRSTGSGHRKGSQYDKAAIAFGIGEKPLRDVYSRILERTNLFIEYLMMQIKEKE